MRQIVRDCLEAVEPVAGGVRAVFRFPGELEVFAGHFPGKPMLPGVLLIEATRHAAERATGRALELASVEEAKFTAEVKPGDAVAVVALLAEDRGSLRCDASLACGEVQVARVRLALRATPH